jgi:hypothetical protein
MTDIDFDDEFYSNVDELIQLANRLAMDVGDEKLAAIFNFAASRYCAYLAASESYDEEELKKMRNEVLDYFCPIYKSNLKRNLDHFESNYENFIEKYRNT